MNTPSKIPPSSQNRRESSPKRSSGLRAGLFAVLTLGTLFSVRLEAADPIRLDMAGEWDANTGQEFPGAVGDVDTGKQVKISYDFTKGGVYISATQPLDTVSVTSLSSIKVKAKGPGLLGVGITDATGQDFIYHFGQTGAEERPYTVYTSKPTDVYGGAGDKVIHYPLKSIRLLAFKSAEVPKGTLVISELQLVPAPTPVATPATH
jgi:hypothetical protein